ncbi:MAG TPA: hypothetical protein VLY04_20110 [Bryobacteraceae bacterium]|nr:hypothetical protein [Bryobacteraceae bacterium]
MIFAGNESLAEGRSSTMLILLIALTPVAAFPQTRRAADVHGTVNLDELARRPEGHVMGPRREIFDPERVIRGKNKRNMAIGRAAEAPVPGPTAANVTPVYTGFQGLLDNLTAIPPDSNGVVGPQWIVTMINEQVLIQSRDGTPRANYPVNIGGVGGFWSAVTTSSDVYDPNIRYDAANDRWIASAAVDSQKSTSAIVVGVSQTGDPGGTWNMYKISVGAAGNWGDYPVLGFNANWIEVSVNFFTIRNSSYVNTTLYVFNKANLYQNGMGSYITFSDPDGEFIPAQDYDGQPNTLYLLRAFAGDVGINNGVGTIQVSKLQGPVGAETFSAGDGGSILINDPWSDSGADGADFAPQLGSTRKIDTGDSRLQNCLLRGGTIWCTHTIFLPLGNPNRSAVQWFQVNPSGQTPTLVQRGRIDDPTGTYFYAYPTIAVNKNGDALIGYNRFSATTYASAEFSFRLASDPASTMEPDVLYLPGQNSYVAAGVRTGSNRWGDFSRTWTDPLDDLTFWTIQEYPVVPCCGVSGQFATWWERIQAPSVTQSQPPTISSGGIGNAASYQASAVAPGEVVTIFGSNLGPAVLQKPSVSASGVVGTGAGGTEVLFDGVAAPMVYASATQVAAVAPYALQGHTSTTIQVEYQGTISNAMGMPVTVVQPGIFSISETGQGPGAILNNADMSVNSASNAAARGSVVDVFITGAGVLTGAVEGTLAPLTPPFAQFPAGQVTATVGGLPTQVMYAGVAPGIIVGVVQVDVVIPAGVTPGNAVPVTISVEGIPSQAGVTVAVK